MLTLPSILGVVLLVVALVVTLLCWGCWRYRNGRWWPLADAPSQRLSFAREVKTAAFIAFAVAILVTMVLHYRLGAGLH
ncbi:hypothetical protein R84981_000801 [Carnimonas sp. R-84981]|uniref:hypothetical protein n=1 Tax=Carnimonas bestiolae TaxID=3402172 RepID=UPI003EDBD913